MDGWTRWLCSGLRGTGQPPARPARKAPRSGPTNNQPVLTSHPAWFSPTRGDWYGKRRVHCPVIVLSACNYHPRLMQISEIRSLAYNSDFVYITGLNWPSNATVMPSAQRERLKRMQKTNEIPRLTLKNEAWKCVHMCCCKSEWLQPWDDKLKERCGFAWWSGMWSVWTLSGQLWCDLLQGFKE